MSRPLGPLLDSAAARLLQLADERPEVAPVLGPVASLVAFVAADADDYVADRLEVADTIRALLARARAVAPDDLREAIDRGLAWRPARAADFRRDAIDAYMARLRRALIAVHAWLETADAAAHHALLDDLWRFLRAEAVRASRLVESLW